MSVLATALKFLAQHPPAAPRAGCGAGGQRPTATPQPAGTAAGAAAKAVEVPEGTAVDTARPPLPPLRPLSPRPGSGTMAAGSTYTLVTRPADLAAVVAAIRASARVGLDTETTALNPRDGKLRLLQLATAAGTFIVDCSAVDPAPVFEALAGVEVVGHNLQFELSFLLPLGFVPGKLFDTMLASQVLDAGDRAVKHTLTAVCERHLGEAVDKDEQKSDWSGPLTESQLRYAARDAEQPVRLYPVLADKLAEARLAATADLENRALPCVARMGSAGVAVDRPAWEALAATAEAEVATLVAEMDGLLPRPVANWRSPAQVKAAFAALGVELDRTDDDTLTAIDHLLAERLRKHRSKSKLAGSYGTAWLDHVAADGRVCPAWRQLSTVTGRMSCAGPNLQQLPRDKGYRKCFVAPPGRVLVKADYSQIELRIAAVFANDTAMIAAYRQGADLHTLTAAAVLGKPVEAVTKEDRQLAKAVNFGLLFGGGAPMLVSYARSSYGVAMTEAQAQKYRAAFFDRYPGLRRWHDSQSKAPVATRTRGGRRRKGVTAFTEKLNSVVQGTAADGMKAALALLWDRRGEHPTAFPVLAVHDELVVECDEADAEAVKAWLTTAMVDGMKPFCDPVPVEVEPEIAPTWGG